MTDHQNHPHTCKTVSFSPSIEIASQTEHGRPEMTPICATQARFCFPQTVKLHFHHTPHVLTADHFKIFDSTTNTIKFHCDGRAFSLREKKVLKDAAGNSILNIKQDILTFADHISVYAGEHSSHEICKFHNQCTLQKARVTCAFKDIMSEEQKKLVLLGNLETKCCAIYLGDPEQRRNSYFVGAGSCDPSAVPVAIMWRNCEMESHDSIVEVDEYCIEIKANVDHALVVAMCIVVEEKCKHAQVFNDMAES